MGKRYFSIRQLKILFKRNTCKEKVLADILLLLVCNQTTSKHTSEENV